MVNSYISQQPAIATEKNKANQIAIGARHPNVAVLDLSSLKCGHDAPTYGLIDSIISSVWSRNALNC